MSFKVTGGVSTLTTRREQTKFVESDQVKRAIEDEIGHAGLFFSVH